MNKPALRMRTLKNHPLLYNLLLILLTLLALYMGYQFCGIWGMILFPIGAMLLSQLWDYRQRAK